MQKGNAGSGPPLYSHPWDECFFALSGELEFNFVERTVQALPGTVNITDLNRSVTRE